MTFSSSKYLITLSTISFKLSQGLTNTKSNCSNSIKLDKFSISFVREIFVSVIFCVQNSSRTSSLIIIALKINKLLIYIRYS